MMVTARRSVAGVLLVALGVVSACGSTDAPTDATAPVSPADTGAARPPDTTPSTEPEIVFVDAATLPAMDVVAALGYPRDLLDRGRVNVRISRDDDTDFVILDKQLIVDHFTPAPVEERRTILPPDGRVVAVQTLFGELADCDSTEPLKASLVVTFTYGDDPTPKTTSIPFTDVSTLDDIRAQKCTVRRVVTDNRIELRDPVVTGETLSVDLVIGRHTGEARLGFDSIKGTVLFGIETPFEPGAPERILEPGEDEAVIPLVIDVNRCDPHAVAETTRKFGIDLYVSVDGSESRLIDVPIDTIADDLEAMLERCKTRTGQ